MSTPLQSCVPKGRVKLTDVNPHLVCVLCHGYFVDATSIVECLHSFCRSCIVLHLDKKSYCPICQEQIQNSKALKPDKALQDIVYKLVPGLFHSEMKRRQEFYQNHPHRDMHLHPESRGVTVDRIVYTSDETISLSLEYYDKECEQEMWKNVTDDKGFQYMVRTEKQQRCVVRKRYLRCPAAVRMSHLKKFIRMKYNLKPSDLVELLYRRESLPEEYSLMDIAYIYTWNRNEPMRFFYKINAQMTVPVFPVANKERMTTEVIARESPAQPETAITTADNASSRAPSLSFKVTTVEPKDGEDDKNKKSVQSLLELPLAGDETESKSKDLPPLPPVVPLGSPISPEGTSRKENVSDNVRNSCANEVKQPAFPVVQAANGTVVGEKDEKKPKDSSDVPMKKLEKLVDQQHHQTAIPLPVVPLTATSKRTTGGESKLNLSISKLIMKNRNAAGATNATVPKFVPTPQQMQQIGMHTSIPSIQHPSTQPPSSQPNAYVRPGFPGMHAFKRSAPDTPPAPVRSQAPSNRPPFIPVRKSYEWNKARNTVKLGSHVDKDINGGRQSEKLLAPKKSPLPVVVEKPAAKNSTEELNAAQSLLRVGQDIRLQPSPKSSPAIDSIHDRFNCESSLQITKVSDPGDTTHQPSAAADSGTEKPTGPPSLQIMRVPQQTAVDKACPQKPPPESTVNGIPQAAAPGKPANKKPVPSLYSMQTAKRKDDVGLNVTPPENGKRMERRVDTENGVLSVSLLTETTKQDMDAKRREVVQPDVSIKLMTFPTAEPSTTVKKTSETVKKLPEIVKKAPELNPIKRKHPATTGDCAPERGIRKATPPSRPKDDVPQLIEINSSPYAKLLPAAKKPAAGIKVLDLSKSPPNGLVKRVSPPKAAPVKRLSPENGLKRLSPEAGGGSPGKKRNVGAVMPPPPPPVSMTPSTAAAINSNLLFAAQRQAAAFLLKQHFDSLNNGLLNRGKNGGTAAAAPVEWPRAMFNPALFARPPPTNLNN